MKMEYKRLMSDPYLPIQYWRIHLESSKVPPPKPSTTIRLSPPPYMYLLKSVRLDIEQNVAVCTGQRDYVGSFLNPT
jgi:hypothetical protein